MAYLELKMWDVLEVLSGIHDGKSVRAVSRITGRDRKTISRYVDTAENLGWVKGLHKPDDDLASEVIAALRPGPQNHKPSQNEEMLCAHHEKIRAWLKVDENTRRGLRLTKILRLLKRQGVEINYSALYRYAVKHFEFSKKTITARLSDADYGEVVEVDFGRLGLLYDSQTKKKRYVHALIVTLCASRHQYVHLSFTQTITDFICGIEDAFEFFGGVTKRVVIDNLKAAVKKANKYNPVFSRTFNEYADYRGFTIDSTDSYSPKQKAKVERQVPYVREDFFRGEQFLNLEHAQREAVKWCVEIAGMRTHGTTRKHPFVEFKQHEKSKLKPLVKERFDTPNWGTPKVHPDCHVRFFNALYSVNFKYVGKETDVRGDSKLVRIYIDGKLVKTHTRQPSGGKSTDHGNDYPKEQTAYTMRDPNYIIGRAKEKGKSVGEYAEHLLGGQFPWSKIRQSQKLMRLCEKYGETTVDAACARALSFDLVNVTRLEKIIKRALEKEQRAATTSGHKDCTVIQLPQLPLRFVRDKNSFNHNHTKGCKKDGTE